MAISFKYLKKRFLNYAFDQLNTQADTQRKFELLLTVLTPESFSDFNIYAFPDEKIAAFCGDIEKTSSLMREVVMRIERKETLVSTFDSFSIQDMDVHSFFTDVEGCYVDIGEHVESIVNSLFFLSQFLNDDDEKDGHISMRRNQAIVQSNLIAITRFIESLYLLQKKIV